MSKEVKVPTLGESVTEATIGEWLKQPGDPVKVDEPIASLETDKVAVEVPSPVAGVMGAHSVEVGATVEVGAVIATIEDDVAPGETTQVAPREEAQPAEQAAPAPAPTAAPSPAAPRSDDNTLEDAAPAQAKLHDPQATQTLSPAVRRAVLEHGVDPTQIKGSGKDGRLTKEDVLAAATAKKPEAAASPAPAPAQSAPAPTRERREEIVDVDNVPLTAHGKYCNGSQHADEPAVKRHAAFPDAQDHQRIGDHFGRAVEQDPAEPAAEDHADGGEEDQVIDVGRRPGRAGLRRAASAEPPRDGEADHVHQAVPADRERADGAERADRDEDGVDRRVGNHCCWPIRRGSIAMAV